MPARVEPDADDAPLGAVSVRVDEANPQLDDDARSLCHDFVVHDASPKTPGRTAMGDAGLAPSFIGVTDPGVAGLLLLDSHGSPSDEEVIQAWEPARAAVVRTIALAGPGTKPKPVRDLLLSRRVPQWSSTSRPLSGLG
jgi:hypothetical protein